MRTVPLGKTSLQVSAFGFGGIPIQRLTEERAVDLIRHAVQQGVNFIDTAAGYGDSQKKIGQAIQAYKRDDIILASKSPASGKEQILEDIRQGCRDMQVDFIDLYQLHNVADSAKWDKISGPDGALEGLRQAKEEGLIRHIGYTSHNGEMALKLTEISEFETVQFPFNMITREPGDELIPEARKNGLGFIVMKPLCGGEWDDAELAFRFLNSYPDLVPIPGIESEAEIDQIRDVVENQRVLDAETNERAEQTVARLGKQFCRRCGYCMPCPQGVPVTAAMIFDSIRKRVPEETFKQGPAKKLAENLPNCTECGECEKACPYDLPIIEKLRSVHSEVKKIFNNAG